MGVSTRFSFLSLYLAALVSANNLDRFNYRSTDGTDFGPEEWRKVSCDDVGKCLGWPDGWELGVGWELKGNQCKSCPDDGTDCRQQHHGSPIDLKRDRAIPRHENENICYDYHWMAYQDGSCNWHDMIKNGYSIHSNNFMIRRHALQILQPVDTRGRLRCDGPDGVRFPRLDYSKGFPNWWFLSHTDITVPSQHTQEGKRYDAEVHLSHFYSIQHQRKVGTVALFLEADPTRQRWDFLDKLICQWRETEEKTRDECGLESVPPYPGCRNPTRQKSETHLPREDPYPFIDCDSIENSQRICKPSSCCEAQRNNQPYCRDDVYGRYGDEVVGSICWWCCPGKLLAPADSQTPEPTPAPSTPSTGLTLSPISSNPLNPTLSGSNEFKCADYAGNPEINFNRMCMPGGCCDSVRSALSLCHFAYKFFGSKMSNVCSECCFPSKQLAPPPPQHPIYPPVDCTLVENPFRICKPTSCCNAQKDDGIYCSDVYAQYGDAMGSVCWYCCGTPKEVDRSVLSPQALLNNTFPILVPTPVPTEAPIMPVSPTAYPTLSTELPTMNDTIFNVSIPSDNVGNDTAADNVTMPTLVPLPEAPQFNCSLYNGFTEANYKRICRVGGCCESTRSDERFCHRAYKFFGDDDMSLVCSQCCETPKQLAPPSPPHSDYSPIDCTSISNTRRLCKAGGCCDPFMSKTIYCQRLYRANPDAIARACWYCCSVPKQVDPVIFELLKPFIQPAAYKPIFSIAGNTSSSMDANNDSIPYFQTAGGPGFGFPSPENEFKGNSSLSLSAVIRNEAAKSNQLRRLVKTSKNDERERLSTDNDEERTSSNSKTIDANDGFFPMGFWVDESSMDPENFQRTENLEQEYAASLEEYFAREEESQRHRHLLQDEERYLKQKGENYINVKYSPYEWMREVRTEYYFRYEGGMLVPPCYETVHWRVLKDPIRIHPTQLKELERLLAWRIAPKGSKFNECQPDTAGRDRPGSDGNAVDLNRPLQAYHRIHRKTFCECKDWDSKFKEDLEWCNITHIRDRLYQHPYNWETKGF